jgi:glucose-1-phosphate cytidylyltransferase
MKVAILAGGLGTRLSEETTVKPKPMVEIGGKPMLWHIMKFYAAYGFNEFVIALGYKGEIIKDYFLNYHYHARNLTVNLKSGEVVVHNSDSEDWVVHLLDTGLESSTGGRVKKVAQFVGNEPFMFTYGDGLCDVNIVELVAFHHQHGKLATVTAVRPPGRFGSIRLDAEFVSGFAEKPQVGEGWINGGFFVLEPEIEHYIPDYVVPWESVPMERLVAEGELVAYRHHSFWQCMDTLRDVQSLEKLWQDGKAPWQVWS